MTWGRIGTCVAVGGTIAAVATMLWAASATAAGPDASRPSPAIGSVAAAAPASSGTYTVDLRDFGLHGPDAPTGTVTLRIGADILGPVRVTDGKARFVIGDVDQQANDVRVSYSGDANFGAADFTLRRVSDALPATANSGAVELSPLGVAAVVTSAASSRSDRPGTRAAEVLGTRVDRPTSEFAHAPTHAASEDVPLILLALALAALAGLGIVIASVPALVASRRST